jgi:flagellar hook-associated protein 2
MAGGINFSGLGSGIDFSKLTEAAIGQASRPLINLQGKSSDINKRVEELKKLNTKLASLTDATKALQDKNLGLGKATGSTNGDAITASASSSAANNTFSVTVNRVATNYVRATTTYNSTSSSILAGGETSATFKLRKGGTTTSEGSTITDSTISLDSTSATLEGLRDAINSKNLGVTANIVNIASSGTAQYKLVLTTTATGASERVDLVDANNEDGTGTDSQSFTALGLTTLSGAVNNLDASITVSGLTVTRPSNSVNDVVTGVTFNIKKEGTANITVGSNSQPIIDKLEAFVKAYNAVQDVISGQFTGGKPTGPLAGDPTLKSVQRQLSDAISSTLPTTFTGSSYTSLAEIGITRDNNGKLSVDTTTLGQKLDLSANDVRAALSGLTTSATGLAHSLHTTFNSLSDSVSGVVQTAINGFQTTIKSLDSKINDQLNRLNSLRTSLTRQFAVADRAINQLNGQGTNLTNVLKSLERKD